MIDRRARPTTEVLGHRSDHGGELVEGCADHDRRGPVRSQTSNRAKLCLESSVIALDPVVRILGGVVERVGEKLVDNAQQRRNRTRGDLGRDAPLLIFGDLRQPTSVDSIGGEDRCPSAMARPAIEPERTGRVCTRWPRPRPPLDSSERVSWYSVALSAICSVGEQNGNWVWAGESG